MAVITMHPDAPEFPANGPLPDPLLVSEPTGANCHELVSIIERLLGLET
jgi:hypothetical protein